MKSKKDEVRGGLLTVSLLTMALGITGILVLLFASPAQAAETITLHTGDWLYLVGALVVPVASALANKTKTDADNKAVGWFSKVVNILALNFKRSGLK